MVEYHTPFDNLPVDVSVVEDPLYAMVIVGINGEPTPFSIEKADKILVAADRQDTQVVSRGVNESRVRMVYKLSTHSITPETITNYERKFKEMYSSLYRIEAGTRSAFMDM